MALRTPEPRLPLEPEEYPLYRSPSRVGCSGLTMVTVVLLGAFAVLLLKLAPGWSKTITEFPARVISGSAATPVTTPGSGSFATQTVLPTPAETNTPVVMIVAPTATAAPQCVRVTGTGGVGVALRDAADPNAPKASAADEGAILQGIGPDVTAGKETDGTAIVWTHVSTPGGGQQGFARARYLQAAPCK